MPINASMSWTSPSVTVSPAATDRFTITGLSDGDAGSQVSITVTARDAFGNVTPGYGGTLQFTSNDPQAELPADTSLASGVGNFGVVFLCVGDDSVLVTDTLGSGLTGTISFPITRPARRRSPGRLVGAQTFSDQNVVLTATFSATAVGSAPMTGTVAFYDGNTYLGTVALVATTTSDAVSSPITPAVAPTTVSGEAQLPTSSLGVGEHIIKAVYSGDANYSPATSETPVSVQVAPATTSTSLAVSTTAQGTTLVATIVVTSPGNPPIVQGRHLLLRRHDAPRDRTRLGRHRNAERGIALAGTTLLLRRLLRRWHRLVERVVDQRLDRRAEDRRPEPLWFPHPKDRLVLTFDSPHRPGPRPATRQLPALESPGSSDRHRPGFLRSGDRDRISHSVAPTPASQALHPEGHGHGSRRVDRTLRPPTRWFRERPCGDQLHDEIRLAGPDGARCIPAGQVPKRTTGRGIQGSILAPCIGRHPGDPGRGACRLQAGRRVARWGPSRLDRPSRRRRRLSSGLSSTRRPSIILEESARRRSSESRGDDVRRAAPARRLRSAESRPARSEGRTRDTRPAGPGSSATSR